LAQFVNLQNACCKECGYVLSAKHYRKHGICVPDISGLIAELESQMKEALDGEEHESQRETALDISARWMKMYIDKMKNFINSQI